MDHTIKLWERVVEATPKTEISVCEQQHGFVQTRSTIDAIFTLRMLIQKYKETHKKLHCVFVDLEKAYWWVS